MRNTTPRSIALLAIVVFCLIVAGACGPSAPQSGPAHDYANAKAAFGRGDFDRALEVTGPLANASPTNDYTDRARILRVIMLGGQVQAFRNLTNTYEAGAKKTKDAQLAAEYRRLRTDNLESWRAAALALGDLAQQASKDTALANEQTLEVPYPNVTAPTDVLELNKVRDGLVIGNDGVQAALLGCQRKAVADGLAEVLGTDRSKAQAELGAGPTKLNPTEYELYLGQQLLAAAEVYDPKHLHQPELFTTLHTMADDAINAALTRLKDSPDPDLVKRAKQLQDDSKAALKVKAT